MNHSIAPIRRFAEVVRLLAAAALGVFAGGMLTEGCVLVPFWQSLSPQEFLAWYALHGQLLHAFFSPLTSVAALLALLAAGVSVTHKGSTRWLTLWAASLALVAVATFFVYFADANASFAQGSLSAEQVAPELRRWASRHWGRTVLVFASAVFALLSLRQNSPAPVAKVQGA